VVERPDGVRIGGCFIAGIIPVSPLSRLARAVELRVTGVTLDPLAERFVRDIASRTIRFVAHVPGHRDRAACHDEIERIREDNGLPGTEDFVFVEVTVTDPSEFETGLCVHGGVVHDRYRVLSLESTSIPNALAALLLYVRDTTGSIPHVYFPWTEGNPFHNVLRFFLFGKARSQPPPGRCCARPSRTRPDGPVCTPADPRSPAVPFSGAGSSEDRPLRGRAAPGRRARRAPASDAGDARPESPAVPATAARGGRSSVDVVTTSDPAVPADFGSASWHVRPGHRRRREAEPPMPRASRTRS